MGIVLRRYCQKKIGSITPPPVKIKLKENTDINPSYCLRPYDTPFHLRTMYEKELKNCLEAGILEKCGTEPSQWSSKTFPVLKGSGDGVRIVADFKKLNQATERPVWPTESSSQLLRHISPPNKYFIYLDLTSGYHQVRVDPESLYNYPNGKVSIHSSGTRDHISLRYIQSVN